MRTFKVLSALLSYPTEALIEAAPELRAVLDAESLVPAASREALDFLRAPVFLCSAPFCTALSIFETRERCSASIALASPPSAALSRRRKWVFTVLLSSRFSARSRSLRRIRFFCEAMLAMFRAADYTE